MSLLDALNQLETVRFDHVGGGVGVLRLHRPERRNAWTVRLVCDLHHALVTIDEYEGDPAADDAVRVLVITGDGDVFSVGADLEVGEISHPGDVSEQMPDEPFLPSNMRIPVIAAINGHAAGAGINFSLHCDIRILADSAKVAFPFVRRGVIPEMGTHWLLPRLVGIGTATELFLTGRTLLSDEALHLGLVHRVAPTAAVLDTAVALAREIVATTAPLSASYTKQLTWQSFAQSWPDAWEDERKAFQACADHPDAAEGVASFMERRPPVWTGPWRGRVPST